MKISVANEFWTADIHWKSEPVEELRQLHALLATDIQSALIGLESLAFQGSLAAALYIAMQLDLHPAEPGNEEVVMKWYLDAATRGSRAASYRLGKLQTDNGDILAAESTFMMSASRDFAPSMYRLAHLYIDHKFVPDKYDDARSILEKANENRPSIFDKRSGNILPQRKKWPRRPLRGVWLLILMALRIPKVVFKALSGNAHAEEMFLG